MIKKKEKRSNKKIEKAKEIEETYNRQKSKEKEELDTGNRNRAPSVYFNILHI